MIFEALVRLWYLYGRRIHILKQLSHRALKDAALFWYACFLVLLRRCHVCWNYMDMEINGFGMSVVCSHSKASCNFAHFLLKERWQLSALKARPQSQSLKCHLEQPIFNLCITSWLWNVGTGDAVCFTLPNPWTGITACSSVFPGKAGPSTPS